MDAFKIAIKLFATSNDVPEHEFVPVFHRWIQTHAVMDHMLIDVADYAHVVDGPGVVLVSHEANIYGDRTDGKLGLLYARKQPAPRSFRDRLRQAIDAAVSLAGMLEIQPEFDGKLQFRTDELLIRVNDRLLAPNTPATYAAVKQDVEAVIADVFGAGAMLTHETTGALGITVRTQSKGSISDLVAGV